MSEPKRVTFETISTSTSKNVASNASAKDEHTVRLELKLFEPNADSFPQFNFKRLCRVEKEKQKVPLPNGFVEPSEEMDHDAAKLALEFERKYGNTYGGGENRSAKGATAADKGSGYDENNGFIDDSEAYDELVPDEMDTDRGGFYINSGHLQFKKLPNKAPKRALSITSGDESESVSETSETLENGNVTKKPKLHEKDKMDKDKKNEPVKSKEMPAINIIEMTKEIVNKEVKTTTVKDMLRAQRDANALKTSSSHINKRSKSTSSATSDDSSSTDSDSSDSSSDANPSRHHSDEDDVFDQVAQNNKAPENKTIDNASASNMLNKIQVNGTAISDNIPQETDVKFLDTLNAPTRDLIGKLVDFAKTMGENAFQSVKAGEWLNEIMKTHPTDSKIQSQIYSYLENVLPYSEQQLRNEVKEYAIRKCENEIRSQERNLQKDINQIMPGIKERYDADLKRVEEQKAAYHGSEKPEQQFRNPRKKFPWNDSLRYSVNSLIAKYQSLYTQKQNRDQTLEQYTTSYIMDKLIPMWPLGWMKPNDIQSHLMGKKDKDTKKLTNEHKTAKPSSHSVSNATAAPLSLVTNSMKDGGAVMAHHADKKKEKSHITKEPSKLPKHNFNDKPTLPKTDKKQSSSDRPMPPSLIPMSTSDAFSAKSATTKPTEAMMSSLGTSITMKQKPITINTCSSNSNGNAPSFSRHSEGGITLPDVSYVSPTKRASDHSISQLISYTPSNHSALTSTLLQQTQSSLSQSSYVDNPTTSTHSVSSKSLPSSTLKSSKSSDSHHRPQSSTSNGSINNNIYNNNNSKQTTPSRKEVGLAIIDLCDTDDGESTAKKPKPHKHKHSKKSKESVGSSSGNSVPMPNTVQSMLNQIHQASSMGLNSAACDEVDHNQIIHDLKELSASNSSRKNFDSILENQSEFKQHYNNYRVSSPPYDRNQDHFF